MNDGNEGLIKIREKGQYETYTEYLSWLNKEIEKYNAAMIKKNSEISELRASIAKLEAEKAKTEKSELSNELTTALNSLKTNVESLTKLSTTQDNSKIDEIIIKNNRIIEEIYNLNIESQKIEEELSKPVNFGGIQDYIKRQEEINDRINDIYSIVSELNYNTKKIEEQSNNISLSNMEQAVNMVSNQEIQPNADVTYAKPMDEQISNYENQLNADLDNEQQNQNEAFNLNQETSNQFNGFSAPKNIESPIVNSNPDFVAPVVGESETIQPDASVLNSIMPQEEVLNNDNNNVIEKMPIDAIQENVQPTLENSEVLTQSTPENNVDLTNAQKVESVEEASPELLSQAQAPEALSASSTKARKSFVNKIKESDSVANILHIDSLFMPEVEMNKKMKEYFATSLPSDVQEQSAAKVR